MNARQVCDMKRLPAMLSGLVVSWPPVYAAALIVLYATSDGRRPPLAAPLLLALHPLTIALGLGTLVACLRHAHRHFAAESPLRKRWTALLLVGSVLTAPVYWWRFVRPTPARARAALPSDSTRTHTPRNDAA